MVTTAVAWQPFDNSHLVQKEGFCKLSLVCLAHNKRLPPHLVFVDSQTAVPFPGHSISFNSKSHIYSPTVSNDFMSDKAET